MMQILQRQKSTIFDITRRIQTRQIRKFHKDYDAVREEQTFELTDGRKVGFAEFGDLQGIPTFAFHGSPGCRYDGFWYDEVAKKLNIHIICPDRPGHGLSTFQPNRRLVEYPNDISQLARHLGISKYHAFGVSGGGPYAIACAYGSPKDELLNTAVIAGMAPPPIITVKDAGWYTVTILRLSKWMPGFLGKWMSWASSDDEQLKKGLESASKYLFVSEEDRARLSTPEVQSFILKTLKEAYAQGPSGALRDAQIYATPWDFELQDVKRKVKLFYGLKDNRTPGVFGKYYKAHLPNAELTEFENATHVTIEDHDEEILADLIGKDPT